MQFFLTEHRLAQSVLVRAFRLVCHSNSNCLVGYEIVVILVAVPFLPFNDARGPGIFLTPGKVPQVKDDALVLPGLEIL